MHAHDQIIAVLLRATQQIQMPDVKQIERTGQKAHLQTRLFLGTRLFVSPALRGEGVRIGVGDGTIRHVMINNLVVRNAECGICIQSVYGRSKGVDISDIAIANASIRRSAYALWIQGDAGWRPRDIRFSNVQIFCDETLSDVPDIHLARADAVTFEGCRIAKEGEASRPLDLAKDVTDRPHERRPANPDLQPVE